mmetsp:Transcript_27891/g.60438  ORF Transcript_27891/g.60438 Transcript_27891/m.60438 type:complete len:222 (-) Transcript_27891:171-836(-)
MWRQGVEHVGRARRIDLCRHLAWCPGRYLLVPPSSAAEGNRRLQPPSIRHSHGTLQTTVVLVDVRNALQTRPLQPLYQHTRLLLAIADSGSDCSRRRPSLSLHLCRTLLLSTLQRTPSRLLRSRSPCGLDSQLAFLRHHFHSIFRYHLRHRRLPRRGCALCTQRGGGLPALEVPPPPSLDPPPPIQTRLHPSLALVRVRRDPRTLQPPALRGESRLVLLRG